MVDKSVVACTNLSYSNDTLTTVPDFEQAPVCVLNEVRCKRVDSKTNVDVFVHLHLEVFFVVTCI